MNYALFIYLIKKRQKNKIIENETNKERKKEQHM